MNSPPKDLLDLLKRYNSDVQELALALREIVLDELAPCYENIIEVYMTSLVYASSERVMKDGICYIGVLKDRVNLGFHHGTDLRDPYGLMEGTGESMRHIKVRHMADALNPALRAYLQEARERVGHDAGLGTKRTVTISVKRKSAAKRVNRPTSRILSFSWPNAKRPKLGQFQVREHTTTSQTLTTNFPISGYQTAGTSSHAVYFLTFRIGSMWFPSVLCCPLRVIHNQDFYDALRGFQLETKLIFDCCEWKGQRDHPMADFDQRTTDGIRKCRRVRSYRPQGGGSSGDLKS